MKNLSQIISGLIGVVILGACYTNPMTGRRSLQMKGNTDLSAMAATEYTKTLAQSKVVTGTKEANMVKNVGMKIKNAAERYYKNIGREQDLSGYSWQFTLIQNSQLNAWCMPGGKVAVYTGILPVTKSETGLAVVMGHEVAHALAGHGNERITQATIAQYGGAVIGGSISNRNISDIFNRLYPIGASVGLMAFGRNQELEADQMGLYLMAMAGYDPREAVPFWNRMEAASSGQGRLPAYLSTHPSPENRIAKINANMPHALNYYNTKK